MAADSSTPVINPRFINLLKKIGKKDAAIFFDCASQVMNILNVRDGDERISFCNAGYNRLTIIIGQRYCLALIPTDEQPWSFISQKSVPSGPDVRGGPYSGNPQAYGYQSRNSEEMIKRLSEIASASEQELQRTKKSGYRVNNNAQFERAVYDHNFRKQLFESAFGISLNLSGIVWKLGCNWGSNSPSFYEMIKSRGIVIGVNDRLYSAGDLIVITEGHIVRALGKVLETPKLVTNEPELKEDFIKYRIDYTAEVNFSKVEWYSLQEDETFTYKLQQGICRVNVASVTENAFSIWNDRFLKYWIFQCNPSTFDFEAAVRQNLLHNWSVTAHKDKIKTGDKVIIWLTGKKAGCYALAQVTGDPKATTRSPDDDLWKTEPKDALKAGIKITHNLIGSPLLSPDVSATEGLKELNVGKQGTNFSATRKEYKALLSLINLSPPIMSDKLEFSRNTILYGPPGTGKTYRLNGYMKNHFTDMGITKTSAEILRESVTAYPFWKVLGAVLATSKQPLTVGEIIEHPIVKARVNPTIKTKVNNLAWGDLQSYADDDSTQLVSKYRRSIKLFHKGDESKWSIAEDKKEDLADIIGQELLDIAASPAPGPIRGTASKTRFNFITFHQKYSYEDFIEGIKPLLKEETVEEQAGELQFELKKGIFYTSCLEALKLTGYESFDEAYKDAVEARRKKFEVVNNDFTKQFALFIDEVNRANISAVFGELITLLEEDKRMGAENEMWVELPYSNEKFCVPANLYVIGTMNTADRSIALLDIALRRRFVFIALYPIYDETEWWSSLLEKINLAIYTWKKNPDFFIGHAFFIKKPESDRLKILNAKIIPLLYEYCQNNGEKVKSILSEAGISIKQSSIKENFQIIAE